MKEKILITGNNGELGSKILTRLIERGESIIALDISATKEKIDSVDYIEDSILNFELINSIFDNNHIKEVYHFAAILSQTASKNPDLALKINEEASKYLINSAFSHGINNKRLVKFFFPSSIAVYGPRKIENATEQDIIKPTTVYGTNKLAIEQFGSRVHEKGYSKNSGLDFRSIRFPGVISYDTVPSGGTTDYAPQMINSAKNNLEFECKLSANTILPFIGINKTILSIIDLMKLEKLNSNLRVFNVEEVNFSVKDLANLLEKEFPNFKLSYKISKDFQSVADTWPSSLNCERAKKYWNFDSNTNFENFILKIINK